MNGSEAAARQLDRVAAMVRERAAHHGDAVEQHARMAELISGYLSAATGRPVTIGAKDAAMICLLLKVSRIEAAGLRLEHVEDIAGYAGIISACIAADHVALAEAGAAATAADPLAAST